MANFKIYSSKSSITQRLKKTGSMGLVKSVRDRLGMMIEIDDHVISVDMTKKWIEQHLSKFETIGLTKPLIEPIRKYLAEVAAERDYLKQLYTNMHGKSWNRNKNWNSRTALTQWEGLEFVYDRHLVCGKVLIVVKRVSEINLRNNYLHGHYAIGATGNIPDDIEKLVCLKKLFLHYNFIEGSLPSTIGNLRKLKTLRLEYNHITGKLPALEHLDALEELYIDNNKIEGGIVNLSKLDNLKVCHIHHNLFEGEIPESMADMKNLKEFWFYGNQLKYCQKIKGKVDSGSGWKG